MSFVYGVQGSRTCSPSSGGDGQGEIGIPLDVVIALKTRFLAGEYTLTSDAPLSIPFGPVVNAHVVVIRATGGPCKVSMTSTLGVAAVQAGPRLELNAEDAPVTALTVQRPAGVPITVEIFLGERA